MPYSRASSSLKPATGTTSDGMVKPMSGGAGIAAAEQLRGKELSYTCLGCHGIDGYRNAYPDYSVPKLEGQNPEYLVAALHGYREGDRSHAAAPHPG